MASATPNETGKVFGKGRFQLTRKVGSGAFGDVYVAIDNHSKTEVAVKLESAHIQRQQLFFENMLYKKLEGGTGVPNVRYFGQERRYNVLAMDLLGPSLEELFNYCSRRFTLKTVLMLADQIIDRAAFVHAFHYVHRDIKPDNLLMGLGPMCNVVYMIDYGLAKEYRDPKTSQHIPLYEGKRSLAGTVRYASVNSHRGFELSRRDDMESIGYTLLYFLLGSLPWQGVTATTQKQRYDRIMEIKMNLSPEELCEGCPREFVKYFKIIRNMSFEDTPDYKSLRFMFRGLFISHNFSYDNDFDWYSVNREKSAGGRTLPRPINLPVKNQ